MNIKNNYSHTLYASYIGYITQAIIVNFAPLLFLTFQSVYDIPFNKITLLITVNFLVQLLVDLLSVKFADKIGYRPLIMSAHIFAAFGIIGLGFFPLFFPTPYIGLLAAVIIYAIGGGIIEVLISPIVEACPTEKKSASMSLLHSFYCWGQVFVILASTLFFVIFSIDNWKYLALTWAIIPLFNVFYFSQVPISSLSEHTQSMPVKKLLSVKLFWMFVLLMICSGASEQAMVQWSSAFAESGLQISKTVGDLEGPCMFAILMGLARVFYSKYSEKINLRVFMICSCCLGTASYLLTALSTNAVLALVGCALCGLAAGILWPGTFSLASASCPSGGTAMFAMLALAGDLGCSLGPTVVGIVSDSAGNNLKTGLLAAVIFPILMILGLILFKKLKKKEVTVDDSAQRNTE